HQLCHNAQNLILSSLYESWRYDLLIHSIKYSDVPYQQVLLEFQCHRHDFSFSVKSSKPPLHFPSTNPSLFDHPDFSASQNDKVTHHLMKKKRPRNFEIG